MGRCIHIEDIYVKPAHRRCGMGSRLFADCVEKARVEQCARLEWNVLDWNVDAKRFYHHVGASSPDNGSWELMRLDADGIEKYVPPKNS